MQRSIHSLIQVQGTQGKQQSIAGCAGLNFLSLWSSELYFVNTTVYYGKYEPCLHLCNENKTKENYLLMSYIFLLTRLK